MQQTQTDSQAPLLPAPSNAGARRGWGRLRPRFGIASRLAFGLAAVAAVIVFGHEVATRTTRQATEAVRRMQSESEPVARRADAVLERLVAYDRAVGEYLEAGRSSDFSNITQAGDALQNAVTAYYDGTPDPPVSPAATVLRGSLSNHVDSGERLARSAAQRAQWVDERNTALEHVYHYITSAGGAGMAISGSQVIAQRSLAELAIAIGAVRGNFSAGPIMARKEQDFAAVLSAHTAELQRSPGKAWLDLVREDFARATHLRNAIEHFDAANGPARRELMEDSATLTASVEEQLQTPARRGLLQAAEHAATSAELA